MSVEYIGQGIAKGPNDQQGWATQSVIPVFSAAKIPKTFPADVFGVLNGEMQTIDPIKVYDVNDPQRSKLLAPWPSNIIYLNNFQIEMLWALNADKVPGETMPDFNDIINNSNYTVGSVSEIAGAPIPQQFRGKNKFIVEKIYIGSSKEYMKRSRERAALILAGSLVGILLIGTLLGFVLLTALCTQAAIEFFNELDIYKYGVYYIVGKLEADPPPAQQGPSLTTAEAQAALAGAASRQPGVPETPTIYNIGRNSDNFAEAIVKTKDFGASKNLGTITTYVKFVFDNGVEKYAEIVSVENTSLESASTETMAVESFSKDTQETIAELQNAQGATQVLQGEKQNLQSTTQVLQGEKQNSQVIIKKGK